MGHSILHIPYFSSTPILLCGHNGIEVRPPRRNDSHRTSNICKLIAKRQPWNFFYFQRSRRMHNKYAAVRMLADMWEAGSHAAAGHWFSRVAGVRANLWFFSESLFTNKHGKNAPILYTPDIHGKLK
jgi:hypothetical protein